MPSYNAKYEHNMPFHQIYKISQQLCLYCLIYLYGCRNKVWDQNWEMTHGILNMYKQELLCCLLPLFNEDIFMIFYCMYS